MGFVCLLGLKEPSEKPQHFNEPTPKTLGFIETD